MLPPHLLRLAEDVLDAYRARGLRLATAESCTGGLIAGCLTEIAGSSDVVERGFVTYSNDAKVDLLGVPAADLEAVGAVSAEVASAMAEGALRRSNADVAVSVTGIAGPSGATEAKPLGLVYIATARRNGTTEQRRMDYGAIGRSEVREATVVTALEMARARATDD